MSEDTNQVIQIQMASNEAYLLEENQAIALQVWHSDDDRVRECAENYAGHIKTILLLGAHAHRLGQETQQLINLQLQGSALLAADDLRRRCLELFGPHSDQHAGLLLISAAKTLAEQQKLILRLEAMVTND